MTGRLIICPVVWFIHVCISMSINRQVTYPDAITLMEHLQGMGEASAILTRRPYVSRETFLAAAAIYQG